VETVCNEKLKNTYVLGGERKNRKKNGRQSREKGRIDVRVVELKKILKVGKAKVVGIVREIGLESIGDIWGRWKGMDRGNEIFIGNGV
jgi:hypothetical protein